MARDSDPQHDATIDSWRRKRQDIEDRADHMESTFRDALAKALRNPDRRRGVARDLKASTLPENRRNYDKGEGGFGVYDDGEVITGYDSILPGDWNE